MVCKDETCISKPNSAALQLWYQYAKGDWLDDPNAKKAEESRTSVYVGYLRSVLSIGRVSRKVNLPRKVGPGIANGARRRADHCLSTPLTSLPLDDDCTPPDCTSSWIR